MNSIIDELKKARQQKKISLEEISDQTRINTQFLERIEAGEIDFLPRAYVKAFIKTYAKYIGMNMTEIIPKIDELFSPPPVSEKKPVKEKPEEKTEEIRPPEKKKPEEPPKEEKIPPQEKKKNEPEKKSSERKKEKKTEGKKEEKQVKKKSEKEKIPVEKPVPTQKENKYIFENETKERKLGHKKKSKLIPVISIIVTLLIIIILQNVFNKREDETPLIQSHEILPEAEEESPAQERVTEEPVNQTFTLECRALELTWFRIAVDGDSVREYTFYRGDSREWNAEDSIVMRIGKAQGLEFILNGTKLDTLGRKDQLIWRVRFTENGVENLRLTPRTDIQQNQ